MKNSKNIYLIPGAIVIAGIIIAGAVFYLKAPQPGGVLKTPESNQKEEGAEVGLAIVEGDHVKGDPNASVVVIEFSDFECPFCARFHETMNQIIDEYGESGQVAWVYRHFPLDQLHPVKARQEAVASECANELGGNDAFWQFTDRFFELTPSNNRTDLDVVFPQIVQEIGLDQGQFQACLESGRYDDHIQENIDEAVAMGGRGTPWSIIVTKGGEVFPVNGAQPYQAVKQLIDSALSEE